MKKLYGLVTAMVTPFDDTGKVDLAAVRELTNFYIRCGVQCLYPNGTTGEMYLLSVEERKKIAETVVQEAQGRVTVFIHTGAMNLADTVELSRHAHEIGADGIGVVTPSYFHISEREMVEYYAAVARSVPQDFPVYLYNIPQLSGNDLNVETIEKILLRAPNVTGIKYSYPDMERTRAYLKINNGNFSVLIGNDCAFYDALCLGCDGVVSGTSSAAPEPFEAIYAAYCEGDFAKSRQLQTPASEVVVALKNGSMAHFKAVLTARGLPGGNLRSPLLNLTEADAACTVDGIKKLYQKMNLRFKSR